MNNTQKILGYAAAAFIMLFAISLLAGFFAWVWAKILLGFAIALVIWIVQLLRKKSIGDTFVLWWGVIATTCLVAIDLMTGFIMRFSWLIIAAAIIGFLIFLWTQLRKK